MTFEKAYTTKYPSNSYVLKRMREYDGEPTWEKFNKPYLTGLTRHFRGVMSDSSARTALATVRATMNDYSDVVALPSKFEQSMVVKNVKSVETWLTESELTWIEQYVGDRNEMSVLHNFLIAAWTGARYSDLIHFDDRNIVNGRLTYVSQKTNTRTSVPVKPLIRDFIGERRLSMHHTTYNRIIKRICQNVGIVEDIKLYRRGGEVSGEKWNFISSHTARRSFATNLYLRNVDVLTVGLYMGHASIEMTKRYIVCETKELTKEEVEFFR